MTVAEILDIVEDKEGVGRLLSTLDVPAFSIRNPTCVGEIRRREPLVLDDYEFLRRHTDRPIKVTCRGRTLLTRAMWVNEVSRASYPTKEDLGEAVVALLRAAAGGAGFIQFDEPVLSELVFTQGRMRTFLCAALAARKDPAEELAFALSLINRVVEPLRARAAAADPLTDRASATAVLIGPRPSAGSPILGLHVCRGNWSTKDDAAPRVVSCAGAVLRGDARRSARARIRDTRAGRFVPIPGKSIGLGVVNPRSAEVEAPAAIVDRMGTSSTSPKPPPSCASGCKNRESRTTPEPAPESRAPGPSHRVPHDCSRHWSRLPDGVKSRAQEPQR